jgi:hypothetical protein
MDIHTKRRTALLQRSAAKIEKNLSWLPLTIRRRRAIALKDRPYAGLP